MPVDDEVGAQREMLWWLERQQVLADEEARRSYEAGDQLMATWWDGKGHAYEETADRLRSLAPRPSSG